MDPIVARFCSEIDKVLREYFNRHPGKANAFMRGLIAIGIGFYSLQANATKEGCRMFLDEIFRDYCRLHAPWQDKDAPSIAIVGSTDLALPRDR